MALFDHLYRESTAAIEDLGRSAFTADHGGSILLPEAVLFHVEFGGLDRIGRQNGSVLVLIGRDQNGHFAFVVLRRSRCRLPERFDPREGAAMVGVGADGMGHGGLRISLTLAAPRRDC